MPTTGGRDKVETASFPFITTTWQMRGVNTLKASSPKSLTTGSALLCCLGKEKGPLYFMWELVGEGLTHSSVIDCKG